MILEVTHDGAGNFKVFPAPDPQFANRIIELIMMLDPTNAPEGCCNHGTPYHWACPQCADEDEQ